MSNEKTARSASAALGLGAFLMVIACVAGPAILGAVTGSAIGGWLGVLVAIAVAVTVAFVLRARRSTSC